MLRSLAEGRGGGWVQRGGQESGGGGVGGGGDEGGRMSCLVPLPACALVECGVTWKRPSFSLPLSETRILCPTQKRHCPLPDTLPVSRLTLSSKNTHSQKCIWKQGCNHKRSGLHITHIQMCPSHSEWALSFPQTGRVNEDQTNTQNPIILRLLNYYD